MTSVVDELWRSAQKLSWSDRPHRPDVEAVAAAVHSSDLVVSVHRLTAGLVDSSALVITSRALLVGSAHPGRHLRQALSSAPAEYRYNSRVLAIPRDDIAGVSLTSEAVLVRTAAGLIELTAPAGANRHEHLERAVADLGRRGPGSVGSGPAPGDPRAAVEDDVRYPGLWSSRHLVDGEIVITRAPASDRSQLVRERFMSAGRAWRQLPRWAQWGLAIAVVIVLQTVAAPAGLFFAVLLVLFIGGTDATEPSGTRRRPRSGSPEGVLAVSRTIEARVAAAACRAWEETVREPSWSSPALAGTRETFDGEAEVDAVVDLALRIHDARKALGARPTGPAADYWRQQRDALDRAALRLGDRADALIRHRDQAAELSTELAQLAELERLERSAVVVDDLTIATAAPSEREGHLPVAEQVVAAREAVGELIDLMTRTRAPLADPSRPPTF